MRAIVENSYSGNIQVDKDGNPITSKEDSDNHGIGIFSIKEIIKRYSGEYIVNTENGVFMTEVILNIWPLMGFNDRLKGNWLIRVIFKL